MIWESISFLTQFKTKKNDIDLNGALQPRATKKIDIWFSVKTKPNSPKVLNMYRKNLQWRRSIN